MVRQARELAVALVVNRRPGRAALGQAADHAWLFPGSRPGAHLSSHHLNARLKSLGIDPQAARNTTLLDLASQLPAAVLSSLLGLGITTATACSHHAGHRAGYAAVLTQRQGGQCRS